MLGHILNCIMEHCFLMHFHTVEELCSSEPLPYDKPPVTECIFLRVPDRCVHVHL